jgi:hypothetical protein
MGFYSMRRIWLLISCITFVVVLLKRSNHDPDRVWDTPAYLESMLERTHLHPLKFPPHRKLQFGLLETVRTHRTGTPAPPRFLG